MSDNHLVIMPMPALVAVLANRATAKGTPLTESEVLAICGSAECTVVPRDVVPEIVASRGYEDISPENAWNEWNAIRPSLGL